MARCMLGSRSTWRKSSAPAASARRLRCRGEGQGGGGYTLAYKEILWSTDTGLWIATLYVDPGFRGKHLSPILIDHARRRGWELGEEKIYLASEHTNYYEKFGSIPSAQTPAPGANPPDVEADTLPPSWQAA